MSIAGKRVFFNFLFFEWSLGPVPVSWQRETRVSVLVLSYNLTDITMEALCDNWLLKQLTDADLSFSPPWIFLSYAFSHVVPAFRPSTHMNPYYYVCTRVTREGKYTLVAVNLILYLKDFIQCLQLGEGFISAFFLKLSTKSSFAIYLLHLCSRPPQDNTPEFKIIARGWGSGLFP